MLCLPFEISSTLNLFCVEMKKTEVRIWILDFVCYPTFEYLIGHKWRIQNTPPHIADFCQGIYQDQALRNLSKSWKFQSNVWTKERQIRSKKRISCDFAVTSLYDCFIPSRRWFKSKGITYWSHQKNLRLISCTYFRVKLTKERPKTI